MQLTRHDVERFISQGYIAEDGSTELLDGLIVLKDRSERGQDIVSVGPRHRRCVERFSELRSTINAANRHVETQQPLVCSETHTPEPDFMVLRGRLEDYEDLATANDAYCVLEVADSSYERDAGVKLAGYARAGIQQYIIINLRNRTAEVYTQPEPQGGRYALTQIVQADQPLLLRVGEDDYFSVALSALLP